MAVWKLSNQEKKSVEQVEEWRKGSYVIHHTLGWRFGEFLITTPDDAPPAIDLTNPEGLSMDELDDYEIGDLDDGCYAEWSGTDGVPDEVLENVESMFEGEVEDGPADEDGDPLSGDEALEADGWELSETTYTITGPLVLERLPD
jgi:hypothetical protein